MKSRPFKQVQISKAMIVVAAISMGCLLPSCGVKGRPSAPLEEPKIGTGSPQAKQKNQSTQKQVTEESSK